MSKTIKYTGAQVRWPELAYTGKQSVWQPGEQDERSDAEAALLLATGLFTQVYTLNDLPLPSLVSGAGNRRAAVPWQLSGRVDTATSFRDATMRDVYQVPFDFWGLKWHAQGASDDATINCLVSVAVSANLNTPYNPTGAWNPVLFGGAALHNVPAATSGALTSDCVPSDLASDLLYLPSIARDDGGAGRLIFVASYRPLAGNTKSTRYTIGSLAAPIGVSGIKSYYKLNTDAVTTPANFGVGTEWDNSYAGYFEFLTGDAPPLLLVVGDSRVGGIDSLTQGLGAWRIAVDAINSSGIKLAFINQGFGGQKMAAYFTNGVAKLTQYRPSFASFMPWSPNDADKYSQAGVARAMDYATRWVAECQKVSAAPILQTPPPVGGISGAEEAYRRQVVEFVRKLCSTGVALLADSDATFTDYSTSAGGWKGGGLLNATTLHPNYLGHQTDAAAIQLPLLQRLVR
jgi:hypothetical protein